MRRFGLGLAMMLSVSTCTTNHECREGTVLVVVNFASGPEFVDGLSLRYRLDGGPLTDLPPMARPAGAEQGSFALEVKNYGSRERLFLQYAPRQGGRSVGAWQEQEVALKPGCTAIELTMVMGVDAGGITDAQVLVRTDTSGVTVDAVIDRAVPDTVTGGNDIPLAPAHDAHPEAEAGSNAAPDLPLLPPVDTGAGSPMDLPYDPRHDASTDTADVSLSGAEAGKGGTGGSGGSTGVGRDAASGSGGTTASNSSGTGGVATGGTSGTALAQTGGITGSGGASALGGTTSSGGTTGTGGTTSSGPCGGAAPPNFGNPCGSCGGTVRCDGTCSVPTPSDFADPCGSCGGTIRCDGTCGILTPPDHGNPCGSCGGTVRCDGTCSMVTPPDFGSPCGSCGGTVSCDGTCSVSTPPSFGLVCDVGYGKGACANGGTVGCDSECQPLDPAIGTSAWHLYAAPNGSWDWNCDGVVSVTLVPSPVPPACSTYGDQDSCENAATTKYVTEGAACGKSVTVYTRDCSWKIGTTMSICQDYQGHPESNYQGCR